MCCYKTVQLNKDKRGRSVLLLAALVGLTAVMAIGRVGGRSTTAEATRPISSNQSLTPVPGTVDGGVTPEAIPDDYAYMMLFRLLAGSRDIGKQSGTARRQAYLKLIGIEGGDADVLSALADEYGRSVKAVDDQIKQILESAHRNEIVLAPHTRALVDSLHLQRSSILSEKLSALHLTLSPTGLARLQDHVAHKVKLRMKILPNPQPKTK